ncbi:LysR family transcriptional regulator [Burkholderia sp. SRS-W-2-2016]|nr:LysR family transcriptional regulator [Burkholderia sp. SRS-W-2-2016]
MTRQLPPLYALRAFESAARTGAASLAAEELHLTQSAVSKHIKTLEAYFDCQLFTRKGPRMLVTPQGQIFAEGLKHGFKQIEEACAIFQSQRGVLRLKAPPTLTMRWLLSALRAYRETNPGIAVQTSSIWMDIDTVDFFSEPYDCAILLGSGGFGAGICSVKLFDEWLIPICAPSLLIDGSVDLSEREIIHPSPDRRDWRRWLARANLGVNVDMTRGQVFDTLEHSNAAAIAGHGISIGDLALCADAITNGQLALPFTTAVSTGDGYYMVWPERSRKDAEIRQLLAFLAGVAPSIEYPGIHYVE